MAEFEKTTFEFPDEKEEAEAKAAKDLEESGVSISEPEIEIVDDTPAQDRGRKPLDTPPEAVTEEELSKYSDKRLKERLAHLGRGYHDERRAKEAAFREKEEALRLAQTVVDENKKLKGSLNTNQEALLEQAKRVVANEVETAKRAYKEAYESGDSDRLVEAQEKLTTAKIRADKVSNFKPTPLQTDDVEVQTTPITREAPSDPKVDAWQAKNPWFGKDRLMTSYALALHEQLVLEDGVDPTSDEYYKKLNGEIRQRFSDKFASDDPAEANSSQRPKANVVAPATRSTASKKIVLSPSQVNIAKRLGIPLELYARKVAEEMRKT